MPANAAKRPLWLTWLAAAASALAVLLAVALFNDQDDPPDSSMDGLMSLARRIAATDDRRLPPEW